MSTSSDWKQISEGKKQRFESADLAVVMPTDELDQSVPAFCPVCRFMMRTEEDVRKYEVAKCCHACGMKWADARLIAWNEGWRPSPDEINSEIEFRKSMPLALKLDSLDS